MDPISGPTTFACKRARVFIPTFIPNETPNGRTYNFEGIPVAEIRALVRG